MTADGHLAPSPRPDRRDGGFALIEVIVALGIVAMVMTSLTSFMVGSRRSGHYSAQRDSAVQLAVEGMEKARAVRGSALLSARAACTASCAAVVSATVTTLLGSGVARWDAAAAGTLTLPPPATRSDGSVVDTPTTPGRTSPTTRPCRCS